MAQEIKQGNIFGRIGTGFGRGLAEQIPKEVERNRLSSGLQQFERESANLSPTQQLARLSSIPGITPQMIQSFGDLARQQARGQSLIQASKASEKQPAPSPFPERQSGSITPGGEIPSITQEQPLEKIQEGYIPRTQDQILEAAGERYNKNPALYNNDPQKAIETEEIAEQRNKDIEQAYERKHENLSKIQDNVVNRLKNHANSLGVQIPANVYSKIEDEAIQATKPKNQGGGGLTEQQAMKQVGQKLDGISRDYESINALGDWGITGRKADETLSSLKSLQKKFGSRNDTENFADKLISTNKLSPMVAYSIAEPVSRNSKINNEISALPSVKSKITASGGLIGKDFSKVKDVKNKTLDVSRRIAPLLDNSSSPLAISYELQKKGYDPSVWMDYLNDHRDELKLTEAQGRQLGKPRNFIGTLNDWWLQSWSGLNKSEEK